MSKNKLWFFGWLHCWFIREITFDLCYDFNWTHAKSKKYSNYADVRPINSVPYFFIRIEIKRRLIAHIEGASNQCTQPHEGICRKSTNCIEYVSQIMKSHFLGIRTCPACQTSARVSKLRVEIENETDKRRFFRVENEKEISKGNVECQDQEW